MTSLLKVRKSWLLLPVLLAAGAVMAMTGRAKLVGDTPAERIDCICTLADKQPWGAGDVIAAAATEEPDQQVRRAAVVALGKFRPDYREVVEAATRDSAAEVRAAAVGTLGLWADTEAAKRLGEIFNDAAEDKSVRVAAVAALFGNKSATATVALVTAVEHHPDQGLRDHASAVLVKKHGLVQVRAHHQAIAKYRRTYNKSWLDIVEFIKMKPETKSAFEQLGLPLVLHPQNLLPHAPCHEYDGS